MRDIRSDLRERLAAVQGRYADEMADYVRKCEEMEAAHRKAISDLERELAAIQQILAIEDQRHDGGTLSEIRTRRPLISLADFIITKVHAHGPMHKEELRSEAELAGYLSDGDGRTFHATIMNITKGGRIIQHQDGRYGFPERQSTLFGTGQTEDEMKTVM